MVDYAYLDLWGYWDFYCSGRLTSLPWCRILFLIGILLHHPKRDEQDISLKRRSSLMCVSSRILFVLGFHLSWGLNVCRKYFNIVLVRIGLFSFIGPWIVELLGPFHGWSVNLEFYPLQLPPHPMGSSPLSRRTRGVTFQGSGGDDSKSRGWRFKIYGMTVLIRTHELYPPLTSCQETIYDAWHVSSFHWILSRIEASLWLPCTSSINITLLLSHFYIFC